MDEYGIFECFFLSLIIWICKVSEMLCFWLTEMILSSIWFYVGSCTEQWLLIGFNISTYTRALQQKSQIHRNPNWYWINVGFGKSPLLCLLPEEECLHGSATTANPSFLSLFALSSLISFVLAHYFHFVELLCHWIVWHNLNGFFHRISPSPPILTLFSSPFSLFKACNSSLRNLLIPISSCCHKENSFLSDDFVEKSQRPA